MHYRFVVLAVTVASWSIAQGCGGDTNTNPDASNDATLGNETGGSDTGTKDTGGSDTGGGDTGTTDASDGGGGDGGGGGVTYVCDVDGGAVTSCAQCTGFPVDCVYCNQNDASVLAGHCVAQGQGCANGAPNNFDVCGCGNDAGNCPESFQVCRNQTCRTCGESNNTQGFKCKNGGTCNAADGGCN